MLQFIPVGEFSKFTKAETLSVGDVVALNSSGQVLKADSSDQNKMPAIGFVKTVRTNYCIVQLSYIVDKSGLTPGAPYWVGAAGAVIGTVPGDGNVVQKIGRAVSSTKLLINIESQTITL